jgi:AhpD family alkylhydroperoxidase
VPERLKVLAELKAGTLTRCAYCIDIGSQIARRVGVSDQQLLALPRPQRWSSPIARLASRATSPAS